MSNAERSPPITRASASCPGVGDYTAAAIASIAFGLPHAVVDGNVRRVISRLTGDPKPDVQNVAELLLDRKNPAHSNQALMELGALVCLPRDPLCDACPLTKECQAREQGRQTELPAKKPRQQPGRIQLSFLVIRSRGKILLSPSSRVRGFWDLPEAVAGARFGVGFGSFRHSIMNTRYACEVREAAVRRVPKGAQWHEESRLDEIPLSTTARKALRLLTA